MEYTEQDVKDIAYAVGALTATLELFIEGRTVNKLGVDMVKKSLSIIERLNISNEELGFYIKSFTESEEFDNKVLKSMFKHLGVGELNG